MRFYGRSPLLALRPGDLVGPELVLPHGRLYAGQAVLAVNSAAQALDLPVGTVLPLEVYAVATEPLSAPACEALGGRAGHSVVDAVPLAPYFRLLPDRGLVAGGGTATLPAGVGAPRLQAVRERAWARLERWLRSHPDLARVRVTHRWSGRIGMTGDDLPVVGPVPGFDDVWYIGGCCGHGLALSVAHGAQWPPPCWVSRNPANRSRGTAPGPRACPRGPGRPCCGRTWTQWGESLGIHADGGRCPHPYPSSADRGLQLRSPRPRSPQTSEPDQEVPRCDPTSVRTAACRRPCPWEP